MALTERRMQMIKSGMKTIRMEDKKLENSAKPALISEDVLQTGDFVFSPFKPNDHVGDSGNLLIAKRKQNRAERYLVKHEFCDCAANEFVYTKLVQAMDLRMPDLKLFQISAGEKRRYFKTEYIMGAKFLDLESDRSDYQRIRECAINWSDFFGFRALYNMLTESDSFEIVLSKDHYIYRVDTTASFCFEDYFLSYAGFNRELNGQNVKELIRQRFLSIDYDDSWRYIDFAEDLHKTIKHYGEESKVPFLKPFQKIGEIPPAYIDDFLNTLCYFYPDFIGECYKRFIQALQKQAGKFLKTII